MPDEVTPIAAVVEAVREDRLWQRLMEIATIGATGRGCASSLSYLARFFMRGSPIGRFTEVVSDLIARRDATKSLSPAFEGRECQL